jgi:hypothetical protein
VVETGGLENRCTGNRTGGSNPSPSATQSGLQRKLAPLSPEVREGCPYFAIIPRQTGLRRTHCSASNAALWRLFSGRHIRSPVSRRASGECNAIRSWGCGPSELTSGSALETEVDVSRKPVSGPLPCRGELGSVTPTTNRLEKPEFDRQIHSILLVSRGTPDQEACLRPFGLILFLFFLGILSGIVTVSTAWGVDNLGDVDIRVTHVVPHNLRPCAFAQHMAGMHGTEASKIPFIARIGRVRISANAVCQHSRAN